MDYASKLYNIAFGWFTDPICGRGYHHRVRVHEIEKNHPNVVKKQFGIKQSIKKPNKSLSTFLNKASSKMRVFCPSKDKSLIKKVRVEKMKCYLRKSKGDLTELVKVRHKEADLICPICLKFIVNAVSTICGHTFCSLCLDEFAMISPECLVCQKHIRKKRKYGRCKNLDSIIENMLEKAKDKEEKQDYEKRKKECLEWEKNKKLENVEVGRKVDVRSPEHVWCVGIIRRIVCKQNTKNKMIYIHYEGFPNVFDESILEGSERLAKYMFYTAKEGIPKMVWSEEGKKVITIDSESLGYDILGIPKDSFAGLVDSDESDIY